MRPSRSGQDSGTGVSPVCSWFATRDRVLALEHTVVRWLGTPFVPNSAEPGPRGGVSCQKLVAEIYFEVGFIGRLPIPDAAMSHARANRDSLVEEFMSTRPEFERLKHTMVCQVEAGDLLGFRIGQTLHHMGVAIRPASGPAQFVHAIEGLGVVKSLLSDPTWFGRLAAIWRPAA